jgi:hypothetical protein
MWLYHTRLGQAASIPASLLESVAETQFTAHCVLTLSLLLLPRQSDDHGHLLTEQEARLATQVDFVMDLAGRVDGLSGWTQQAQQSFDKADTRFEQVWTDAKVASQLLQHRQALHVYLGVP